MARMNWVKATTRSKISRLGFEQGSEFGDVIDKSRQRAAIVHAKLTSSSQPIVKPAKSERQRQHEMRMRQQAQDKKRKQLVSDKAGTRTPQLSTKAAARASTPNAGKDKSLNLYLENVKSLVSSSTHQAAYELVIDDFLKEGTVKFIDIPKPIRRLVEAMILIRLSEKT